jgi:hypothetical protein
MPLIRVGRTMENSVPMTDAIRPQNSKIFTRRRLLGAAATTGGAALGMMALPSNLRKALASPLPTAEPFANAQ